MVEATPLNVSYATLEEFANGFALNTDIKEIFEIEKLLKLVGGEVIKKTISEWKQNNFNHVEVRGENDFSIFVYDGLDKEMCRLMVLQGFFHYVIHAMRGKKPCYIKNMLQGLVAKEGLLFTLVFLIPDKLIVKMIADGFSHKEIANLFRVPEDIVELKLNILDDNRSK